MLGKRGQYIVEYALLIVVVAIALAATAVCLHRAVQGQTQLIDNEFSE